MPTPLTNGSLFSGIGGIDLGFERAGIRTLWQVEMNEYARRVLARRFPSIERRNDVRDCNAHNLHPVDILSGGFPCQDISSAGRGAGIEGSRSGLWFEFRRIIAELRPRWVLIENVPALRLRGADVVLAGMEELGYACWPVVVGAWAVGAPHKRDRVWIVANSAGSRCEEGGRGESGALRDEAQLVESERLGGEVAHSHGEPPRRPTIPRRQYDQWLVEPDVGRVAHGVPSRVDRLRCLGNSVVPDIPELIGRWIVTRESRHL